jgi:hypothetical protein
MIVSRRIDTQMATGRKLKAHKSVQYRTGGDDPVFMQPFQTATFNLSRKIRKPIPAPFPAPSTNAPLMTLQEGSDLKRGVFMTESVGIPLKVPVYVRTVDVDPMEEADEINTDFQMPTNFNAGIRPGVRGLTFSKVSEPAAPMFRAGRPATTTIGPTQFRDRFSEELAEMLRTDR